MSAAHTPAPWAFVQGGSGDFPTWNVRIGNRGLITLPATASMETMDADARLIAAAPELLEALQALVKEYEPNLKVFAENAPRRFIWQKAVAIIAKAEGR